MKKVVIVGGGFAGSTVARMLERKFDVTLIDTKDYFEFTPGVLRSIVEPKHTRKIQKLHTNYLHRAKFIRGEVRKFNRSEVFVGKDRIAYDYLVIAAGSRYFSPMKEEGVLVTTRASHLRNAYRELCAAKSVLIVGGGLVGLELAGEIISHYPKKKLTIVHAMDRLIERNPIKASKAAENFLKKRGVSIIYNEMVLNKKKGLFTTNKKNKIQADLAFVCTGIVPNTEFLQGKTSFLNDKKYLSVNCFLQTKKMENVFVAGDIAGIGEEKTAQNAECQARLVVNNIIAHSSGKELAKYSPRKTPMVISLGDKRGIFVYKNFVWYGFIPSLMKGFVEWKEMWKLR